MSPKGEKALEALKRLFKNGTSLQGGFTCEHVEWMCGTSERRRFRPPKEPPPPPAAWWTPPQPSGPTAPQLPVAEERARPGRLLRAGTSAKLSKPDFQRRAKTSLGFGDGGDSDSDSDDGVGPKASIHVTRTNQQLKNGLAIFLDSQSGASSPAPSGPSSRPSKGAGPPAPPGRARRWSELPAPLEISPGSRGTGRALMLPLHGRRESWTVGSHAAPRDAHGANKGFFASFATHRALKIEEAEEAQEAASPREARAAQDQDGDSEAAEPEAAEKLSDFDVCVKMSRRHAIPLKEVQRELHNFRDLDANGDGELSIDEFISGLKKQIGMSEDDKIPEHLLSVHWKEADKSGNGLLDFEEYLGWKLSHSYCAELYVDEAEQENRKIARRLSISVMDVEATKKAFLHYDTDGSGFIDEEEFRGCLMDLMGMKGGKEESSGVSEKRLKQFFLEADQDKIGELNFEQFVRWYYFIFKKQK